MIFDRDVAVRYGLEEAIMIRHFQFWIEKNVSDGRHMHDGHTWTYGTPISLARYFQFWTPKTVRRILQSLSQQGVLVTGNYNPNKYDRTLWYAFKDECMFLFTEIHLPKWENGLDQKGTPIPDISTDSITDKKKNTCSFDRFWEMYPKKVGRGQALKVWEKLKPDDQLLEVMLQAITAQKALPAWKESHGQFIPHPATWLNGERWKDEIVQPKTIYEETSESVLKIMETMEARKNKL